jgi:hypothetical protein
MLNQKISYYKTLNFHLYHWTHYHPCVRRPYFAKQNLGLLSRGSYGNSLLVRVDPPLRSSKFFFEKLEPLQARMTRRWEFVRWQDPHL